MPVSSQAILKRRICVTLGLVFFATPARAQQAPPSSPSPVPAAMAPRTDVERFRARVEAALASPRAQKSFWGVLVEEADTGERLFELNADRYFVPASNTKLFTTALAMSKLGPAYRFTTTIETHGILDPGGRLRGDLALVGRGDPDLSNRKFPYRDKVEREGPPERVLAELADAVVAKGVKQIEGDVVADDSYFLYERYPPGWEIGELPFAFSAPISAIAVNDNTFTVEMQPAGRSGSPAILNVEPWAGFYTFENKISTGPPGSDAKFEVAWEPGSRNILLRGSIPLGSKPSLAVLAIEEPSEYAAHLLKRLLEERGVRVFGQARAQHTPAEAVGAPVILAEHLSPPLLEIIRTLNKISQNLHAEMLLRAVARLETGVGSREAGLKLESEFIKSAGIAETDVYLTDGSGLSRVNLVTPRAVVTLLRYIARQTWGEDFISTLPIAGRDGTLENDMKDTPAAGRIRAKTGSLEHAKAISGFATTLGGTHVVFAIFGNNYTLHGRDANAVLEALSEAMVEEIGKPVSTSP
jgi:D-alanyl-D-alanine carboxypeptidase/D-alanyl-D-alanine-endopeptidase (penicillin-binding protein 4)